MTQITTIEELRERCSENEITVTEGPDGLIFMTAPYYGRSVPHVLWLRDMREYFKEIEVWKNKRREMCGIIVERRL